MERYRQVLGELFARQARRGMKLGLDRVRALLDALGAPDGHYPVILVAGTNGKGSTCAFTASLLRHAGMKAALYTSPHLCRFTERIVVDGEEIPQEDVVRIFERVIEKARAIGVDPTFFEVATAMALISFAERSVDIAVLEVGLGGRLDATNATQPVVVGITPVDIDHTAILGNSVEEIAREKAGVMRAGRPAVIARQGAVAARVIEEHAARIGARVRHVDEDAVPMGTHLALMGAWQRGNAAMAVELVREAGVVLEEEMVRRALSHAHWPGRYEWLRYGTSAVLLDGAHNPHGVAALGAELARDARVKEARRVVWVVAATGGRDAGAMMKELVAGGARAPDEIIGTQARVASEVSADEVALAVGGRGIRDAREAMRRAVESAGAGGLVVMFGSLYAVGEVRAALTVEEVDDVALSG